MELRPTARLRQSDFMMHLRTCFTRCWEVSGTRLAESTMYRCACVCARVRMCARLNVLRAYETATMRLKIARIARYCYSTCRDASAEKSGRWRGSPAINDIRTNGPTRRTYIYADTHQNVRKRRSDTWKYRRFVRSRCAVYDFARRCTVLGLSREIVVQYNL